MRGMNGRRVANNTTNKKESEVKEQSKNESYL